jgi:hypothetical protein
MKEEGWERKYPRFPDIEKPKPIKNRTFADRLKADQQIDNKERSGQNQASENTYDI